ncbi:MAG: peptidoglycan glycosyltransferase [Geobacteraceae bacterium]|nr:peptidoglycan glycosyltransferase [Geobacteraceae bacterium]
MKDQPIVTENSGPNKNLYRLSIFAAAIFFLLLLRLWYLQILEMENYQNLSESNRLRLVPVAASRGTIFDRNGKVMVSNRPSFSVAVIPQEVQNKEVLLARLSQLLGVDRLELLQKWEKGKGRARYYPIILASGITRDQLEILEENRMNLPGIDIQMHPVRDYPNGIIASHLLGYLGELSEQEMASELFSAYNPGDYVGKSGIERNWEKELHGVNGGRQLEVDAMGRVLKTVSEVSPTIGNSMVLTIDLDMQKKAEEAFGEQAGAAVAMDLNSGEVLVFVSKPDFDPALFAEGLSSKQWNEYLADTRHPLENKALKGQYPPGSTFKIITAMAGLEEGLVDENTSVNCNGSYVMGNRTFKCWNRKGHGTVNLRKALRESCDVYFYKLGERLGVDKIAWYARKFALGAPMGIGLENEKGGLIPTAAWKEKRFGKKWLRGETIPISIGQGYLLMTPIQLASMIAAVANEGTIYRPRLVRRIINPEGQVIREFHPEVLARLAGIKPGNYRLIKEGLFAVVNERGGTGGMARLYEVKVAGKTGTSQVVKLRDKGGAIPYQYRDHALFVAFAPYEKPEVAVAVVVEHGEHGGSAAAPIAGRILRQYFEGKGIIKKPTPVTGNAPEENSSETPVSDAVPEEAEQTVNED